MVVLWSNMIMRLYLLFAIFSVSGNVALIKAHAETIVIGTNSEGQTFEPAEVHLVHDKIKKVSYLEKPQEMNKVYRSNTASAYDAHHHDSSVFIQSAKVHNDREKKDLSFSGVHHNAEKKQEEIKDHTEEIGDSIHRSSDFLELQNSQSNPRRREEDRAVDEGDGKIVNAVPNSNIMMPSVQNLDRKWTSGGGRENVEKTIAYQMAENSFMESNEDNRDIDPVYEKSVVGKVSFSEMNSLLVRERWTKCDAMGPNLCAKEYLYFGGEQNTKNCGLFFRKRIYRCIYVPQQDITTYDVVYTGCVTSNTPQCPAGFVQSGVSTGNGWDSCVQGTMFRCVGCLRGVCATEDFGPGSRIGIKAEHPEPIRAVARKFAAAADGHENNNEDEVNAKEDRRNNRMGVPEKKVPAFGFSRRRWNDEDEVNTEEDRRNNRMDFPHVPSVNHKDSYSLGRQRKNSLDTMPRTYDDSIRGVWAKFGAPKKEGLMESSQNHHYRSPMDLESENIKKKDSSNLSPTTKKSLMKMEDGRRTREERYRKGKGHLPNEHEEEEEAENFNSSDDKMSNGKRNGSGNSQNDRSQDVDENTELKNEDDANISHKSKKNKHNFHQKAPKQMGEYSLYFWMVLGILIFLLLVVIVRAVIIYRNKRETADEKAWATYKHAPLVGHLVAGRETPMDVGENQKESSFAMMPEENIEWEQYETEAVENAPDLRVKRV